MRYDRGNLNQLTYDQQTNGELVSRETLEVGDTVQMTAKGGTTPVAEPEDTAVEVTEPSRLVLDYSRRPIRLEKA